jgi:hypothetical protein
MDPGNDCQWLLIRKGERQVDIKFIESADRLQCSLALFVESKSDLVSLSSFQFTKPLMLKKCQGT